ncbi:hypothetical protein RUND412_004852 [Rhizina undulata]
MAPATPRLRILSVGGNAVSAFLSWRLQATQSCDVTLVWKSGYEQVSQYGISFRSNKFGNERFKPHSVVRSPEDGAGIPGGFDYVLLCVKALPDVYDLAAVIESVVTPQHTCILVNTTNALGIESYLESRFPANVVLSLVSGANLIQHGPSDFEHTGLADVWVGSSSNANFSSGLDLDMAEALALTLASGSVDCHVSPNIRQLQWERMIGPIAFHPLSVLLETGNHAALMEKPGIKKLISDLIDELMDIAKAQSCTFPDDFKQTIIDAQLQNTAQQSTMFQDFSARRPLEIETFLGSPIKFAQSVGVKAPHTETLYAVLRHVNQANQSRTPSSGSPAPSIAQPNPGSRGPTTPRSQMNGAGNRRPPPSRGGPDPQMGARRGPPQNAYPSNGPSPNGLQPNAYRGRNGEGYPSATVSRRNSFENDLEEFGHIALFGDTVDGDEIPTQHVLPEGAEYGRRVPSASELALREREIALRQRELALREQELSMRQGGAPMKHGRRKSRGKSVYDDDEDDDDVYYDPGPPMPRIDPDSFDMMSMTSRRTRRLPSSGNLRSGSEAEVPLQPTRTRQSMRAMTSKSRTSARLVSEFPMAHDSITDNSLMGYSSNRYGNVDRKILSDSSRANSLTAQKLEDIHDNHGPGRGQGGPYHPQTSHHPRRPSLSPGDMRPNGHGPRQGYPQGRGFAGAPNGQQPIRQPVPKYPNGQGLPHQVEQQISDGVSQAHPLKGSPSNRDRSTTGSASASNDSNSGISAGETSAYSSSSSLERRPGVAVR